MFFYVRICKKYLNDDFCYDVYVYVDNVKKKILKVILKMN